MTIPCGLRPLGIVREQLAQAIDSPIDDKLPDIGAAFREEIDHLTMLHVGRGSERRVPVFGFDRIDRRARVEEKPRHSQCIAVDGEMKWR